MTHTNTHTHTHTHTHIHTYTHTHTHTHTHTNTQTHIHTYTHTLGSIATSEYKKCNCANDLFLSENVPFYHHIRDCELTICDLVLCAGGRRAASNAGSSGDAGDTLALIDIFQKS